MSFYSNKTDYTLPCHMCTIVDSRIHRLHRLHIFNYCALELTRHDSPQVQKSFFHYDDDGGESSPIAENMIFSDIRQICLTGGDEKTSPKRKLGINRVWIQNPTPTGDNRRVFNIVFCFFFQQVFLVITNTRSIDKRICVYTYNFLASHD